MMLVTSIMLALSGAACGARERPPERPAAPSRPAAPVPAPAPVPIAAIVAGHKHSCLLQGEQVRCWGGRGCGGSDERTVEGLPPIRALFSGDVGICAVAVAGGVWCWSGYTRPELLVLPGSVTAPRLDAVVDVAIHGDRICLNDTDGAVGCWWRDRYQRLRPDEGQPSMPLRISTLAASRFGFEAIVDGKYTRVWGPEPGEIAAVAVVHAERHACAVDAGGNVSCWALFVAPGNDAPMPTAGLPPVAELVAGREHFCARTRDGEVWCWGGGSYGQLGLGVPEMLAQQHRPTRRYLHRRAGKIEQPRIGAPPRRIPGLVNVRHIAAGSNHTCAVVGADALHCWGANHEGQLGLGEFSRAPRRWPELHVPEDGSRVFADAATCVLADGTLRCAGALYQQPRARLDALPIGGVALASAGRDAVCTAPMGGQVTCWGERAYEPPTPFRVPGAGAVIDLASRGGQTCAVGVDGQVRCWGAVDWSKRPALAFPHSDGAAVAVPGLTGVIDVEVGGGRVCALRQDGVVLCDGQPVRALKGRALRSIAALQWGVCGLEDRGGVACEGVAVPPGLPKLLELSAGTAHLCGRGRAGEVVCWGDNARGQLGDGSCDAHTGAAVSVVLPAPAYSLAAGDAHTCALLEDGALWCWGTSGDGATFDEVPRQVASPALRGPAPPMTSLPPIDWAAPGPDDGHEGSIDATLRAALGRGVTRDCYTLGHDEGRCDARGDLDGDGLVDHVVTIRRSAGRKVLRGLAIVWGKGGVQSIGAGELWALASASRAEHRGPDTDLERDLAWLADWDVFPRPREGFSVAGRFGSIAADPLVPALPDALGDGLTLTDDHRLVVLYQTTEGWRSFEARPGP